MNSTLLVRSLAVLAAATGSLYAADEPTLGPSQQTAVEHVASIDDELCQVNQAIWEFAEVGLEEHRSSSLLQGKLKSAGFEVKAGIAGMPTAFVASYGSGQPVIAILAEYDALPGLSQQVTHERKPVVEDAPGHGCGHSGLGTAALGAALAVKRAMDEHKLPGTVRLYGTPAEETLIGKVYMTLAGSFDDVDVCLHYHPGSKNETWSSSSKALVSAKFTFSGTAAHASGSPDSGRSALDAVELMNVGSNFMREHVKEDARIHYVITDGGGAPNVVPAKATVWYFIRADKHQDVETNFRWLQDIAQGAALMTRTKMNMQIDTDCHEIIPNAPLSELIYQNMKRVGAPTFTEEEHEFARRLQAPITAEFGTEFAKSIDAEIHPVPRTPSPSKGSTDVGDISWRVPTGGLRTTCMVAGSPGHSWQNVAAIGSSIGEKGIVYAAKVLAASAIELLENPQQVAAAKADWRERTKDRKYFSFIPEGQQAPAKIR